MKKKTISVIGIGRVGLPLALFLSDKGFKVFGVDSDRQKIQRLDKGEMPFFEEGAGKLLKKHIKRSFVPTADYSRVKESATIILTLGTPVDPNMDPIYDQIDDVLTLICRYLKKNQLLILRSTIAPKTTLYVKDFIEKKTRLKVGINFFLAYCPERIAEGRALKELGEIPQIVGGVETKSSAKAALFFTKLGIRVHVSDSISAELAKLFTNMYRYISFAMANEFMVLAENFSRDIYEIVNLVNKDYKRGGLSLPGLTGGPCLFKDGFFLINENPYLDLIVASWKINESIPLFFINKVRERICLNDKKVALLGLAFKPEIDDIRESLSFKLKKGLLRERARVFLHDPWVKNYAGRSIDDLDQALDGADVVFVATRHKFYEKNRHRILKSLKKGCFICDIWNIFGTNKLIFKAADAKST